ncbi:uncharacterized protein LOC106014176 [Aplysia californica]|uniref:Uncharacterized protein LOC106014176 n=1 Tax=Aplysia californica TaxID=6500 RepID=A0ABM1AFN1_APLCA|nr:uncharacterized protein LOC106014176 [Aplysia californica]
MPDTVKLSKHRGKVYVGLSDAMSSASSSHRENRSLSRDRSSAATTIGRASIIDWSDNASEAGGSVSLSGELTVMLPPVPGVPANHMNNTSPGLDTSDFFRTRTTIYNGQITHRSHRSMNKSPRPPPSRGSPSKTFPGFRPPQNSPFVFYNRGDEFSASFRRGVTPRSPKDNSAVVVCGGGITPLISDRQPKYMGFRRDSTNMGGRRRGRKSSTGNTLGMANFDLPMIDLKCLESPVPSLGNLEEKGIRLVKLRRLKKTKRKSISHGKNGASSDASQQEDNSKKGSMAEDGSKETDREESGYVIATPPENVNVVAADSEESVKVERITEDDRSSLTTSSGHSTTRRSLKVDTGLLLVNREPYSTPLLPDVDTSRSQEKSPGAGKQSSIGGMPKLPVGATPKLVVNETPRLVVGDTPKSDAGITSLTVKNEGPEDDDVFKSDSNEGKNDPPVQTIVVMVETVDATPVPPLSPPIIDDGYTNNDDDDVVDEVASVAGSIPRGRKTKRSSSLLSVPTSDIMTEFRPALKSTSSAPAVDDSPRREESPRQGRTIATQTTPPLEDA